MEENKEKKVLKEDSRRKSEKEEEINLANEVLKSKNEYES